MDYGETVITMAYVRQRWSEWFEVLEIDLLLEDPETGDADPQAPLTPPGASLA
jgi:hypothetical protein